MRVRTVVLAAVVAVATMGCGQASDRFAEESLENALKEAGATDADVDVSEGGMSFTTNDENGKTTVSVAGAEDMDLPASFPKDVPVFPGSKVTFSLSQEDEGSSLVLSSLNAPEKIYDYYLDQVRKNGWEIDQEIRSGEVYILHAVKDDRELAVSVTGDGTESVINITIAET